MVTVPLHSSKAHGWHMWLGFVTYAIIHTLISHLGASLEDSCSVFVKPFSTLVLRVIGVAPVSSSSALLYRLQKKNQIS